ncbi:MAG: ATP-dependent Clp protease adapter ClpS [Acidimicrobiia bacterium]
MAQVPVEIDPDQLEREVFGDPQFEDDTNLERPWVVIVWDDPVNLISYVVLVLQKLFGYSREKAHELTMQIHNEGKAVVSAGTRDQAEADVARLHAHGLWATMQRDT